MTPRPDSAAHAIDQAVDHLQRAAVCLDAAIRQVRALDLPTRGCEITLQASLDVVKDQIDIDRREHEYLERHAMETAYKASRETAR